MPFQQYKTKDDWINHMSWQHTEIWSCQVKGHEDQLFQSRETLISHFREEHTDGIPPEQVDFMVEKGSKPAPDVFVALATNSTPQTSSVLPACPFCDEAETKLEAAGTPVIGSLPEESYKGIRDHIAGHLELIALNSLPAGDEVDKSVSNAQLASEQNTQSQDDATQLPSPSFTDPGESSADRFAFLDTVIPSQDMETHPSESRKEDWAFVSGSLPSFPSLEEDETIKRYSEAANAIRKLALSSRKVPVEP